MGVIFNLMLVFAKVALGAFGGGLATIPFIHHELVVSNPWLTEEMFGQTIALAQMTPGPIALNAATFVGYRLAGFFGSWWATIALVCTPIIIIAVLLWLMSKASERASAKIKTFQKALRPAVAGLLLAAFCTLAKPILPDFSSLIGFLRGVVLIMLVIGCFYIAKYKIFQKYPQLLILVSALAGLCLRFILA